jgi:hypothetical protein
MYKVVLRAEFSQGVNSVHAINTLLEEGFKLHGKLDDMIQYRKFETCIEGQFVGPVMGDLVERQEIDSVSIVGTSD